MGDSLCEKRIWHFVWIFLFTFLLLFLNDWFWNGLWLLFFLLTTPSGFLLFFGAFFFCRFLFFLGWALRLVFLFLSPSGFLLGAFLFFWLFLDWFGLLFWWLFCWWFLSRSLLLNWWFFCWCFFLSRWLFSWSLFLLFSTKSWLFLWALLWTGLLGVILLLSTKSGFLLFLGGDGFFNLPFSCFSFYFFTAFVYLVLE